MSTPSTSSQATGSVADPDADAIRTTRRWLLWSGIALLVIGTAALVFPFLATLVAETFIGWVFIAAGIAALVRAFSSDAAGGRLAPALIGILRLLVGLYLLVNPLGGAVAITLVIAVMFIVDAVVGIAAAFALRPVRGWGWLLAAGLIGLVAGALLISGLPGASLVVLGTIVGITFIADGIACLGRYGALGR